MQITITITGGPEIKAKLEKLGDSLLKFDEEFITLGDKLQRYLGNEVYLSEGQVWGQRWAELSPAYSKAKNRHYGSKKRILEASGVMKGSYFATTTDTAITIMNRTEYAKYHQTGTKTMPQRLLFAFNDKMRRTIAKVVRDSIRKKLEVA